MATEARLEEEKRTRLELEKSLTPRELPIISANGKQNIDPLKPFSGTKFAIECLDDIEPERAAGSLQYALEQAGWKPIGAKVLQRYAPVRDGVLVESRFWEHKNERAAKGLVKFLESINWVANWDFENPDNPKHKNDIPEDAVLIQVGFKPNPYFRPAEQKDLERMMKKRMEKMEEDFNKPE